VSCPLWLKRRWGTRATWRPRSRVSQSEGSRRGPRNFGVWDFKRKMSRHEGTYVRCAFWLASQLAGRDTPRRNTRDSCHGGFRVVSDIRERSSGGHRGRCPRETIGPVGTTHGTCPASSPRVEGACQRPDGSTPRWKFTRISAIYDVFLDNFPGFATMPNFRFDPLSNYRSLRPISCQIILCQLTPLSAQSPFSPFSEWWWWIFLVEHIASFFSMLTQSSSCL